jgi:hypothetical protein
VVVPSDNNIDFVTSPDGEVLDTSNIPELLNTGVPTHLDAALTAGPGGILAGALAGLLTVGIAGVSAWRFGGWRGRSGD